MLFSFEEQQDTGLISYILISVLVIFVTVVMLALYNSVLMLVCIGGLILLSLGSSFLVFACFFINRP